MSDSHIVEYTNRNKMEETTAKVFARLYHMKSVLCKTIKKTPQFCGGILNRSGTYGSPKSYLSMMDSDMDRLSQPMMTSLTHVTSDDTISSISRDSSDSGVSTLSDFSHCSLSSSTSLLNRSHTIPPSCHLRCDPSFINYVSHDLITSDHSDFLFNEIEESPSAQLPLAESSRRIVYENDQTITADDDDEQIGPLTSTLVDGWYTITKGYSAIFRQDLTVRKSELVQVLRYTHPHWVWVRNEESNEGFVPTDCLTVSSLMHH